MSALWSFGVFEKRKTRYDGQYQIFGQCMVLSNVFGMPSYPLICNECELLLECLVYSLIIGANIGML